MSASVLCLCLLAAVSALSHSSPVLPFHGPELIFGTVGDRGVLEEKTIDGSDFIYGDAEFPDVGDGDKIVTEVTGFEVDSVEPLSCMGGMMYLAGVERDTALLYQHILEANGMSPEQLLQASRRTLRVAGLAKSSNLALIVSHHKNCNNRGCSNVIRAACGDRGTCASAGDGSNSSFCACDDTFFGVACEVHNPCLSTHGSPCSNDAVCSVADNANGYQCQCLPGFSGERCEHEDLCLANPCEHGGTCQSTVDGFHCTCRSRFTGERCQNLWTDVISHQLAENHLDTMQAIKSSADGIRNYVTKLFSDLHDSMGGVLNRVDYDEPSDLFTLPASTNSAESP